MDLGKQAGGKRPRTAIVAIVAGGGGESGEGSAELHM